MKIRKAVFPVAGMGTRLLPATKSQPKEMLPVGYKPVVQYVVEEMIAQGLDRFLFITGRKKRSIEDHFDDDPELEARLADKSFGEVDYASAGIEFYYARQRRPTGNGDAVRMAREFIGDDSFVVGFGDTIIHSPRTPGVVGRMMQSHIESGAAATIGVWEVPREETCKYGVVTPQGEAGSDFAIADIVEKPPVEEAPSNLAVAARYIFTPEIFIALDAIEPGIGGELWLADAIRILLQQGAQVRCVRLESDEMRYDIGTPLTYYRAFADFALADPEFGAAFRAYLQGKLA
ncbi:MAG: UTP--glucose-1-phosphate uridylyltransferase [Candidatus Latescibacterota bacterium]|nr:UTP--glucose-1-phosphate uridylyltransferase [Candidatus Latescibacterota bacterium]